MGEANTFRGIFFVLTFFTIGVMSNFRKLWEEGIGKLAAVYVVCLFGFIIWVGLVISWLFFARRETAACRLMKGQMSRREPQDRTWQGRVRAAAANREEADRLEPWTGRDAARAVCGAEPGVSGGVSRPQIFQYQLGRAAASGRASARFLRGRLVL